MWGERRSNSNENVELGRLEFAGRRFAINPQKVLLLGSLEDAHLSFGKLIPLNLSPSFPEEYQNFYDTLSVDIEKDDPVKVESARKLHNNLSQVCYNARLNEVGQSLSDCFLLLYKEEYLSKEATLLLARIEELLKDAIDNFIPF